MPVGSAARSTLGVVVSCSSDQRQPPCVNSGNQKPSHGHRRSWNSSVHRSRPPLAEPVGVAHEAQRGSARLVAKQGELRSTATFTTATGSKYPLSGSWLCGSPIPCSPQITLLPQITFFCRGERRKSSVRNVPFGGHNSIPILLPWDGDTEGNRDHGTGRSDSLQGPTTPRPVPRLFTF